MKKGKHVKKRQTPPGVGLVCLIVSVIALFSLTAVTTARYMLQWKPAPMLADAQDFYFTSDLLTAGDTPVYPLSNFVPGQSKIRFTLRNYADELRVSEADITFTVTATGLSTTSGTIARNGSTGVDQVVELDVPDTAFSGGMATIRVTATATAPYEQVLAAQFELYKQIDISAVTWEVYDAANSNTITLTITTRGQSGTIAITPPTGVLPDRTNNLLAFNGSTCSFNANANAQYSFVFFKTAPSAAFQSGNFTVTGA